MWNNNANIAECDYQYLARIFLNLTSPNLNPTVHRPVKQLKKSNRTGVLNAFPRTLLWQRSRVSIRVALRYSICFANLTATPVTLLNCFISTVYSTKHRLLEILLNLVFCLHHNCTTYDFSQVKKARKCAQRKLCAKIAEVEWKPKLFLNSIISHIR